MVSYKINFQENDSRSKADYRRNSREIYRAIWKNTFLIKFVKAAPILAIIYCTTNPSSIVLFVATQRHKCVYYQHAGQVSKPIAFVNAKIVGTFCLLRRNEARFLCMAQRLFKIIIHNRYDQIRFNEFQ